MTPSSSEPKLRAREPISDAPISQDVARRREFRRYSVELDLSIGGEHNFYAGLVENVSVGGVFIATHLRRPIGEQVEITIHMPEGASVRGVGEVRWVRELSEPDNMPPGMGVRFLELEAGAKEAIERFLEHRKPLDLDEGA